MEIELGRDQHADEHPDDAPDDRRDQKLADNFIVEFEGDFSGGHRGREPSEKERSPAMAAVGARFARAVVAAAPGGGGGARRRQAGEPGCFLGERQERVALGAADATARMFAEKEDDKSEHQREADREGEGDDGHGGKGGAFTGRGGGSV